MKNSTRPPAQYVTAPGTKFRLVANEYDKNKYGQCNYASYRTLIRCKQIRAKEELAKNGGRCEEHGEFAKVLERNHKKEVMRCHAENDSRMQRRRFDPWIASNEYISDEDDYLQAVRTLPIELPDSINDNLLDDHPLRYAGFFTDKDVLKIKMDLVQKDIDDLMEFKELLINQAQKDHELMGNDDEEDIPTDLAQKRLFKASANYARNDYLTLTKEDPVFTDCCFGPDMEESLVISHVVHSLLNKVEGFAPFSAEKQCEKPAIQYSKLCMEHITLDRRQQIFKPCRLCGTTTFASENPLCTFHLKFPESKVSAIPQPVDRELVKEEVRYEHHSSDDDDDSRLGNLSRIESMVSPMQQFSQLSSPPSAPYHHHQPPVRRYQGPPAQVLRPPQMGPPGSTKTAAQRVVANLHQFGGREMHVSPQKEDERDSMTCARVRPIDPNQYGAGKKTAEQFRHHGNSPSPSFQMQQKRMLMPSIVSPSGSSLTNSPGRSAPFAGWRNQAAPTPRAIHQQHQMAPTRFPVQQHRNVPHQPKTIPLERIQEPKTADELVEDRGSPPPPKYPVPEPVRRGVPYYKNASAYRRTEVPIRPPPHHQPAPPHPSAPSTSYIIPPVPPPQPRPRPQASRPVPPHRAIAAGLNPADAITAATPRPSYQIPPPSQAPAPPPPPPPPSALQPSGTPEKTPAPLMTMSMGARRTPVTPSRVTTSYTVIGNRANDFSAGAGPSSSPDSRFNNSALDTARHDARFANMNVKTFLTMGNKDLSSMTQAEIDMIAAAGTDRPKKHSAPSTPQVAAASTPKTTPPGPMVPVAAPVVVEDPAPVTPPKPEEPVKVESEEEEVEKETEKTAKKRKIEETVEKEKEVEVEQKAPESSLRPAMPKEVTPPSEEPPAKKKTETSVEKAEKQDPPKTPRTPSKRSTPSTSSTSSRVPRAAAIAANQAITQHKPTTSGANTTTAGGANPLDLLAELSEAAAAAEEALETPTKTGKKAAKKSRPSTSKKSRDDSEEYEEEL